MSSERKDLVTKSEDVGIENAAYTSIEEGLEATVKEEKKALGDFDMYAGYIAPEHEPTKQDLLWTGPGMVWFCRFLLLCLIAGFACLIAWAATWVPQPCKIKCQGPFPACQDTYWGYSQTAGDHCWHKVWSGCNNQTQSPIDINTKNVKPGQLSGAFTSTYNRTLNNVLLENDGRTVKILLDSYNLTMSGPGLPATYYLSHITFHWGRDSTSGSEHTINSRKYPLEMQMYHFNPDVGPSFEDAKNKEGGVAALAYLFSISPVENPAFRPITDALIDITYPKYNTTTQRDLNVGDMVRYVPEDGVHYYRYNGSLTTPDCSEHVVWTVFADTLKVSELQVQEFRYLLYTAEDQEPPVWISGNARKNQSINNREILGDVYLNP